MIESLVINNYRAFSHFEMGDLGRVNLLVGRNNCGKTSILEALQLLAARGDPIVLWRIVSHRGERRDTDSTGREADLEFDVAHLFHGHELKLGSKFSIQARNRAPNRSVSFSVQEATAKAEPELFSPDVDDSTPSRVILRVMGQPRPPWPAIGLSLREGLRLDALDRSRRLRRRTNGSRPAQFISTESLSVDELVSMWNDIVLTDAEEMVLTALRFLEPHIERVASTPVTRPYYYDFGNRGGFKVKLANRKEPIPIGSFGDGIWRIFAMAIALIRAKDGVFLVDEIDTGLHYSILENMWKFVYETARRFNVQVFATTHSYDCVQSLASICRKQRSTRSNVTIQRIETGQSRSVKFKESEIRIAAERNIEVR